MTSTSQSEYDNSDWEDDSPREGPLSWHFSEKVKDIAEAIRDSDSSLGNLSRSTSDLRFGLRELCPGYPPKLHAQTAEACRAVEAARAQLSAAHAQIYALLSRLDTTHG